MIIRRFRLLALACAASVFALSPASAQEKVLRIAMTASDIPTTTGMPNNGFEGMRFLGFPIFEGLILFAAPGFWKRNAEQMLTMSMTTLRRIGAGVLIAGLVALWFVRGG